MPLTVDLFLVFELRMAMFSFRKLRPWISILLKVCRFLLEVVCKFKEKDNYLKESIGELRKTLPEKLNIKSITSRLLVLETNFLQLESVLSESSLESKNKVAISNKSIESYYNFIYQINKTIEKELQIID